MNIKAVFNRPWDNITKYNNSVNFMYGIYTHTYKSSVKPRENLAFSPRDDCELAIGIPFPSRYDASTESPLSSKIT